MRPPPPPPNHPAMKALPFFIVKTPAPHPLSLVSRVFCMGVPSLLVLTSLALCGSLSDSVSVSVSLSLSLSLSLSPFTHLNSGRIEGFWDFPRTVSGIREAYGLMEVFQTSYFLYIFTSPGNFNLLKILQENVRFLQSCFSKTLYVLCMFQEKRYFLCSFEVGKCSFPLYCNRASPVRPVLVDSMQLIKLLQVF